MNLFGRHGIFLCVGYGVGATDTSRRAARTRREPLDPGVDYYEANFIDVDQWVIRHFGLTIKVILTEAWT
jgi:hypothetical protein